jgi:hypothetical protein
MLPVKNYIYEVLTIYPKASTLRLKPTFVIGNDVGFKKHDLKVVSVYAKNSISLNKVEPTPCPRAVKSTITFFTTANGSWQNITSERNAEESPDDFQINH